MNKRKWLKSKIESKRLYDAFNKTFLSCWACGATYGQKPHWWHGTWRPNERAHIVNQPRREDVRLIVSLCSVCHGIETNRTFAELRDAPRLTLANLLWLKRSNDPANYDEAFILRHSVRNELPTPEPLPKWYLEKLDGKTAESILEKF